MKIIELTNNKNINDFNNYYNKNNQTDKLQIVAFLANWCGFCEKFKPEWQKFKNMAKSNLINGVVATASDKSMGSLKCNNQINGFPTIRIFKNGEHIDYDGERDSKHLTDYLKNLEEKGSMSYFKSNKKDTKNPKIKIKITQKRIPIQEYMEDLSEKSTNIDNLKSENESENIIDTLKSEEEKLKTAKKKIQNHILSKLKGLSNKIKQDTVKRLNNQLTSINNKIKQDTVKKTNNELTNISKSSEESLENEPKTKKVKREKRKKETRKMKKKKKSRKKKRNKKRKKKGNKKGKKKGNEKEKKKSKRREINRKRSKKKKSKKKSKSKGRGYKEWTEFE